MTFARLVLPVVHHKDNATTFDQTMLALTLGADGVFLISHGGHDEQLLDLTRRMKASFKNKLIGLNLLGYDALDAFNAGIDAGADMVWADAPGVTSNGITHEAKAIAMRIREQPDVAFFGSVAFKYQAPEPCPAHAAATAAKLGMLTTTSGSGTGSAPPVEKIRAMRASLGPTAPLAVASGMTVDNVGMFLPMVSHYLVATGVSRDDHHFDEATLGAFIRAVRAA